jgi:hypothetical protein
MNKLNIKYRSYYKGTPPRKIKLNIPGWSGSSREYGDGAKPQPWHCVPFVEGSTYGLELIYPFESECVVVREDNKIKFLCDFSNESPWSENGDPPFASFAPDHYGFTSSLNLEPPEGYVTRIEPHPRFFTDISGTVPIAVTGHIKRWWPKIFFVAFKSPREGEKHCFRFGEPYASLIFVPEKADYKIDKMSDDEIRLKLKRESRITESKKSICKHNWHDHVGNNFDDKYKQLNKVCKYSGEQNLDDYLNNIEIETKSRMKKVKRIGSFVKVKNEALQNKKKKK